MASLTQTDLNQLQARIDASDRAGFHMIVAPFGGVSAGESVGQVGNTGLVGLKPTLIVGGPNPRKFHVRNSIIGWQRQKVLQDSLLN